ncbi:MAG: hypothetical protein QM784_18830 [Polyangiaceae bacterium]
MKMRYSALLSLLAFTVAAREVRAAEDVKVCVDVTLRAPVEKRSEDAKPKAAPAPSPSAPVVNGTTPDGTPPSGDAVPTTPNMTASPSSPEIALPPGPRVIEVDHSAAAEEAASIASEIDPQGTQDPRVQSGAHLPVGQTPTAYLKRLMEHFVTHEPGYVASQEGCTQRIEVELYPLKAGWTAFARYSGTGREERVDQLLPTELSQFAERSVLALLHDVSIGMTVDRDNVLWSDSLKSTQRIRGRGHFVLGVGTRLRAGRFDTLVHRGSATSSDGVDQRIRLFTPMALTMGYRGQFDQFGVEALGEVDLGAGLRAAAGNPSGGHVDYGGSGGVVLHVLRYTNPRGLTSPYFGAGANFAVHWFRAIKAQERRYEDARSTLVGGGLDVDIIGGYEFMRASAISFYLQGELNLPAYVVRSENNDGRINTWFPGAAFRLGASF